MISIAGSETDPKSIMDGYPRNSIKRDLIKVLSSSNHVYRYPALESFKFQLDLMRNIVTAAKDLYRSNFSFEIFRKSKCNPDYWNRTDEGGFQCREDVPPADSIRDIYIHGSAYATECATAIVIVFYKGVLDTFSDDLFNKLFQRIYLMNWQYLDRNLAVERKNSVIDALPGDCRYFKNPDVDPLTPEWQGENVIDMGDGLYYGHGIGVKSAEGIIHSLNKHRIEGSATSAYLLDMVIRLGYDHLAEHISANSTKQGNEIYTVYYNHWMKGYTKLKSTSIC